MEAGIIPAYAGNTRRRCRTYRSCRDHPRVCGEHIRRIGSPCSLQGSSPRMRGTLSGRRYLFSLPGIIPAYAGNTQLHGLLIGQIGDHPRVCGEHLLVDSDECDDRGSSPRMRGTHQTIGGRIQRAGIIPAYAGNTPMTSRLTTATWDHPRVCGEHRFRTGRIPA